MRSAECTDAMRAWLERYQDEAGAPYSEALAELLTEALAGPQQMQVAVELNVNLRRRSCPFSINRRPGAQRR